MQKLLVAAFFEPQKLKSCCWFLVIQCFLPQFLWRSEDRFRQIRLRGGGDRHRDGVDQNLVLLNMLWGWHRLQSAISPYASRHPQPTKLRPCGSTPRLQGSSWEWKATLAIAFRNRNRHTLAGGFFREIAPPIWIDLRRCRLVEVAFLPSRPAVVEAGLLGNHF